MPLAMFHKAKYFGDRSTSDKIMVTNDPVEAKTLGKTIVNFNSKKWKSVCDPT